MDMTNQEKDTAGLSAKVSRSTNGRTPKAKASRQAAPGRDKNNRPVHVREREAFITAIASEAHGAEQAYGALPRYAAATYMFLSAGYNTKPGAKESSGQQLAAYKAELKLFADNLKAALARRKVDKARAANRVKQYVFKVKAYFAEMRDGLRSPENGQLTAKGDKANKALARKRETAKAQRATQRENGTALYARWQDETKALYTAWIKAGTSAKKDDQKAAAKINEAAEKLEAVMIALGINPEAIAQAKA